MDNNPIEKISEDRAFRASELSYRRLFEAAKDGILILDVSTGRITDVNPFLFKLLGFSYSEMIGKTVGELSPFKDIESNQAMLEQLQRHGYVRYEDLPLETRDGRHIAVEFVSNVYQAGDRQVIQCNVRDITERKKSEQHLTLLNACIFNLNDIVLITEAVPIDEPGPKIVFVNEAFERITGYSSGEALGRSPRFLQGEKTDRSLLREIHQAMAHHRPIRRQIINYKKDGTEFWIDIDIVPILGPTGKCTHFAAIERDITQEKRIEQQLLWKTAFFEAQVHSAPDGILVVDREGKKILQNQRMIDLWNIPLNFAEESYHRRRLEWITSQVKEPEKFAKKVAHLYAHPDEVSRSEIELINGKVFDRYSAPVRSKDGKDYGRIWTYRDITDQKRDVEKIAEQAAFLDKARDAIIVHDLKRNILFWNKGAERMYGWTRQEVIGQNIDLLICPESKKIDEIHTLTISDTDWYGELQHLTKDRREITVEARWTLIRDNNGEPKSVLAINTDVTERKKIEAQFMRAQRMESIGTLAGGIAHDLNNILTPIMMAVQVLKETSDPSRKKSVLETLEISAQRGADIVRQVLSFARGLEGERVEIQLCHLLKDLVNIVQDTFPKDIQLRTSIAEDAWTILGDRTQVHQILLNLCVNARDAMPNGGSLIINVENCILDEQYATMNTQAKVGRYVKTSIVDSGTGMSPAVLDKIFEPFFTTKDINKGTGLGLSTVMAIVKSHDGLIEVSSELGKGTTFKVYLPAMKSPSEKHEEHSACDNLPRGNGELILVVDDEASILSITNETLQIFGYRVLTATDGADAVAVYAEHKNEIAVVLTDMMMPIMDGRALVHALTRMNPKIKIIAASGLIANGGAAKASGAPLKHFLAKPYTSETLLKAIRSILDES